MRLAKQTRRQLLGVALCALAACDGQQRNVVEGSTQARSEAAIPRDPEAQGGTDAVQADDLPGGAEAWGDNVAIEPIDKSDFDSVGRTAGEQTPAYRRKIDDLEQAVQMLDGRVVFADNGEVESIRSKTGRAYGATQEEGVTMSEMGMFVAFYPDEDILLLEGGHSIDVVFDLTTGAETEQVGNPEHTSYSQNGKRRVIGSFGGQECFDYTLQVRTPGGYRAQESAGAGEAIPFPCVIGQAFWVGDEQWFYSSLDYSTGKERYYRMRISPGPSGE